LILLDLGIVLPALAPPAVLLSTLAAPPVVNRQLAYVADRFNRAQRAKIVVAAAVPAAALFLSSPVGFSIALLDEMFQLRRNG
jgi:hypothetical protein